MPAQLGTNGMAATIIGGVIEYKKFDKVSIDSETLKISGKTISPTYEFTNHSDKDITTDVAFSHPASPVTLGDIVRVFPDWNELYHAQSLLDDIKKESLAKEKTPKRTLLSRECGAPFTDLKILFIDLMNFQGK
ncbi:DUF4424 family protein [Candidatus Paracaedibacter symbiosus]|uniref:DUF4424 family protein n=1 Tax=Candidatus Paracaedibacter symbiosus TaxID=244582 RepID=UPI000509AD63|nr:DUF4424 family protein [Candidatus Paracaedibacter symbiosus]